MFFLYVIILGFLCSCSTIYYSHWDSTTYDPSQHTFEIDSAYLTKYGAKASEQCIRTADNWIVDSLVYFYFSIERKKSTMPIIPIFYKVYYQKKNDKCNFQVSIGKNKIYKSLDSVSYTIYDSLETVYYKGGYNYRLDITQTRQFELFETPYLIDIYLKETGIVYGDIEFFFTDYNNISIIEKIKFKYEEGKYFTRDINS